MLKHFSKDSRERKFIGWSAVLLFLLFPHSNSTPADTGAKSERNLLNSALVVAHTIEDVENRMTVLWETVSTYNDLGQQAKITPILDELLEIAQTLKNTDRRDQALMNIAKWYVLVENFSGALETTKLIETPYWQAFASARIAEQYVTVGKKEMALQILSKAIETAKQTKPTNQTGIPLAYIAAVYAKAGKKETAEDLLWQTYQAYRESKEEKAVLTQIALRYNEIGQPQQALKIIKEESSNARRQLELTPLLVSLDTKRKDFKEILGIIEKFNYPRKHDTLSLVAISAMIKIAHQYASRNQSPKASAVLSAAGKRSRKLLNKKYSAEMLIAVAHEYMQIGKTAEASHYLSHALKKTPDINPHQKIDLLAKIAVMYAELGQIPKAQEIVKNLSTIYAASQKILKGAEDGTESFKGLKQVSAALNAANTARKIEDSNYEIKVLGAMSKEHAENNKKEMAARMLSQALKTIQPQEKAYVKASKLLQLAREYARARQTPDASDLMYLDEIVRSAQS